METVEREEPKELEAVRKSMEQWRQTRAKLGAMPAPLWDEAASVARSLGVGRVARVLGLNSSVLKQRALPEPQGVATRRRVRAPKSAAATFVEMAGPVVPPVVAPVVANGAAVLEVVAANGARMTIRFQGAVPDLTALVASFR